MSRCEIRDDAGIYNIIDAGMVFGRPVRKNDIESCFRGKKNVYNTRSSISYLCILVYTERSKRYFLAKNDRDDFWKTRDSDRPVYTRFRIIILYTMTAAAPPLSDVIHQIKVSFYFWGNFFFFFFFFTNSKWITFIL